MGLVTTTSSPSSPSESGIQTEKNSTSSQLLEQDAMHSDDLDECVPTKSKRKKYQAVIRTPYQGMRKHIRKTVRRPKNNRSHFCMRTPSPTGIISSQALMNGDTPPRVEEDQTANNIEDSQSEYSPLKYFESTGTLRSLIQTTHRGFGGLRTPLKSNEWDRETRIRISYRIRLRDNHVQFALIIYEHLLESHRISRRNLMNEFSLVADEDSSVLMSDDDRSVSIVSENNLITHHRNESEAFRTPPATPSKKPKVKAVISDVEVIVPAETRTVKQKPARSLRLF